MKKDASIKKDKALIKNPKLRNFQIRLLTGMTVIVALALGLLLRQLTVFIFDVFLLAILVVSVYEVMKATKAKERNLKYHFVYGYLFLAYLIFFIGQLITPRFDMLMHFLLQVALLAVFMLYTFFMYYVDTAFIKKCNLKKLKIGKESRRVVIGYLKIIAYPCALIYALFALNHFNDAAPKALNMGLFGLLLVFVISAATDTFAFAVGITLKGPKLCPKISPKKTWSGAIGGLFGGVIGALTLVLVISSNRAFGTYFLDMGIDKYWGMLLFGLIGLIGSVLTQAGDIFASYIKRKNGIKDFGKILPGHGGAMDRIDGNIFCAVFIFIVMSIICFIL